MGQLPLFGEGSRGGKVKSQKARKTPLRGSRTPEWELLHLKHPPPCSVDLQECHEVWGDGVTPFTGIRRARWRRWKDGESVEYCNTHAEPIRLADEKAADAAKTWRSNRGHQAASARR